MHHQHPHADERVGGQRDDRNEGEGPGLDRVRAESGQEDAWETSEPLAREGPIGGRDGRDRVGDAERVADEDQDRKPRGSRDDHPGREGRDGRAGHREDQPKPPFVEETEVPDATAAREGASPIDLVRPAAPVVDLIDRMGLPTLDEAAEGQGDREPRGFESSDANDCDRGSEDDGRVRPK